MNIWFTSDTHFFHQNVLEHNSRQYGSLEEMHEAIIQNWNSLVKPGDSVYHLGDFALSYGNRDKGEIERLYHRLTGHKHLILGNHDRREVTSLPWAWQGDYKYARFFKQRVVLFHYAIRSWRGMHRGAWHLHGHSHGNLSDIGGKVADVGWDVWRRLVSLDEIRQFMDARDFIPVDHHGAVE